MGTQFFLLHSETRKNLIATSVDAYSELEIRSVIAKSFEMSMIWSEGHVGLISKLLYPEVDGSAFASAQIDINDFMSDCDPYYTVRRKKLNRNFCWRIFRTWKSHGGAKSFQISLI